MSNESVPFSHWIFLGVVVALVWILGAEVARSAELGEVGFVTEGTHICASDRITPQTIDTLNQWGALIERLEAVGGDHSKLSDEDNSLGNSLVRWCATMAEGYPVVLLKIDGDHALFMWDKSLNFTPYPFIIKLSDFHSGGLQL